MKYPFVKRTLLLVLQGRRCAMSDAVISESDWTDLHHSIRPNVGWARLRWPLFIDSVLNLRLVLHGAHMMEPQNNPKFTDAQIDRVEHLLKAEPRLCNVVNGSSAPTSFQWLRAAIGTVWDEVKAMKEPKK